MLQVYPQLRDARVEYAWGGTLDVTFDMMPHAGQLGGLHYAIGYAGHGVAMATYLGGLWYGEDTTGGRVNWWLHTLALLTFLPLIPHTKHLHLALSPITVFLKRQGFSRIPPLAGD